MGEIKINYKNIPRTLSNNISEYNELDYAVITAFSIHANFNHKHVVAVADTEKYLVYIPGEQIDHKLSAGDKLIPQSVMHLAISNKQRFSRKNDASLFGFPYVGVANPILSATGSVLGGLIICENIQHHEELSLTSKQLTQITLQIIDTVTSLEKLNNTLLLSGKQLSIESMNSLTNVKSIDNILNLIKGISTETNILGLNAAIEAARAGDAGRGFAVVSTEVRKLATESLKSVNIITATLNNIRSSTDKVNTEVNKIGNDVALQANVVNQISAIAQELKTIGLFLNKQAEKIVGD